MRVGFLAADQPVGTRPRTFVRSEDAERLVRALVAERISSKLIRAFPPDSNFFTLPGVSATKGELLRLNPIESNGTRFVHQHTRAGRYVREMHRLGLIAFANQFKPEPAA